MIIQVALSENILTQPIDLQVMTSQQMYLVEIFIDQISVFLAEGEEINKNLIIKIIFGPGVEFIVKESQLAVSPKNDDVGEKDEKDRRKWTKDIRVGKAYLFPSYADTVIDHFRNYPLQMEVWNDDINEEYKIFVGIGRTEYDTAFTVYLKDTTGICQPQPTISVKSNMTLYAECCCVINGEITYILRLSALGDNITTDFQQSFSDPEKFNFLTDKVSSIFQCQRIEYGDKNYVTSGGLYELAMSEGPHGASSRNKNLEVCTELESCNVANGTPECENKPFKPEKTIAVDKIRMGEITGPCGNTSCPLAHRVKAYVRNMHTYKKSTADSVYGLKDADPTSKICGRCSCKNDEHTQPHQPGWSAVCPGCGGTTQLGETCQNRLDKLHGTGVTPIGSKTHLINYMVGVTYENPELVKSLFGHNFIVAHNTVVKKIKGVSKGTRINTSKGGISSKNSKSSKGSSSQSPVPETSTSESSQVKLVDELSIMRHELVMNVYNAEVSTSKGRAINNFCTDIPDDKDCTCNPPKPTAPCKTFDCECMTETEVKDTRKHHKQYCPRYVHKDNCPVTMLQEEDGAGEDEEEEPEINLPYGLPPIQLGPCPVLGRPCTVPDGFARMYRVGALPNLPPSYSEAGKVCCSKEYERIKKAAKEYINTHKDSDYRCLNKWYVDTETRCCDKEQRLLALLGKSCCGSHKLALNEKYAEEKRTLK